MTTMFQKSIRYFAIVLIGTTFLRCGGGDSNFINIVVNGQTYEMSLQNSQCQAGVPSGVGLYNLPISCSAGFSNTSGLADAFVLNVTDVRVVEDQLGMFIPVSPSLILMSVTLDGTQMAVISGGVIFSQVSNLAGGKNCFEFELQTTTSVMNGGFCANNSTGF